MGKRRAIADEIEIIEDDSDEKKLELINKCEYEDGQLIKTITDNFDNKLKLFGGNKVQLNENKIRQIEENEFHEILLKGENYFNLKGFITDDDEIEYLEKHNKTASFKRKTDK